MEAQNAAPAPAIHEAVSQAKRLSGCEQLPWPETSMLKLLDTLEPTMHELARFIPIPREDALQSMRLELLEHFRWNSGSQREQSGLGAAPFDNEEAVHCRQSYTPLKWK